MNPDLGHHQNTRKPVLPKPHLSHQITKTCDASQTQKNSEKHTNIPAFFLFFFFPPARRYSLCVFLGIVVNGTRFKLSLFNIVSLSFSVYLTSFSSLQIDAHEQVLSVSISLICSPSL
jgi:hypothetical protein